MDLIPSCFDCGFHQYMSHTYTIEFGRVESNAFMCHRCNQVTYRETVKYNKSANMFTTKNTGKGLIFPYSTSL